MSDGKSGREKQIQVAVAFYRGINFAPPSRDPRDRCSPFGFNDRGSKLAINFRKSAEIVWKPAESIVTADG